VIAEVYEVEGVHCPRCIQKIAAALADIDGLLAADANLMGEITVRLDGPAARERVQEALAGVGFPVASIRPAAESGEARARPEPDPPNLNRR
jgi:copper chaperone CopZ